MRKVVVILLLCFITVPLFAQTAGEMKIIEPEKYEESIKIGAVQLIDVRTPEEFREGHIDGAVNIDLFSDDFSGAFAKFNKNQPVYIYCRSGNRSQKAAVKLSEMGFQTIIDLRGGFKAWTEYKKDEE